MKRQASMQRTGKEIDRRKDQKGDKKRRRWPGRDQQTEKKSKRSRKDTVKGYKKKDENRSSGENKGRRIRRLKPERKRTNPGDEGTVWLHEEVTYIPF